ncbi:MAG: hypothetical protein Kow00107_11530 [Planctomycetota bacterium]
MEAKIQSPVPDHSRLRVKIDETLMNDIIKADSYLENETADDRAERVYEHNCNRRELKLYNLLRQVVGDANSALHTTRIRLRLVEEGKGLYLEMDI